MMIRRAFAYILCFAMIFGWFSGMPIAAKATDAKPPVSEEHSTDPIASEAENTGESNQVYAIESELETSEQTEPTKTEQSDSIPEGLQYKIVNDEIMITRYNGSGTQLVIPSMIEGYPVTTISSYAFRYSNTLTEITIPEGVKTIGDSVFPVNSQLTSIIIPNSVISIGTNAFDDCMNLQYHTYNHEKYLGNAENPYVVLVDAADPNITACQINGETRIICDYAFENCSNLTELTIPKSVVMIGRGVFNSCENLSRIIVDENNSYYCTDEFGVLYNKEKTVLNFAPMMLDAYTIPYGVTEIGEYAFYQNDHIRGIIIPDGVISIGDYAFVDCDSLAAVQIPGSVTSIGDSFNECYQLRNVVFQGNAPIMQEGDSDHYSFYMVTATMYYPAGNETWTEKNMQHYGGVLTWVPYEGEMTIDIPGLQLPELDEPEVTEPDVTIPVETIPEGLVYKVYKDRVNITGYTGSGTELVIPAMIEGKPVVTIAQSAFKNCTTLTSVTIPNTVTWISDDAFMSCTGLTDIVIPDSVTHIWNNAFRNCRAMTNVTIGSGVESIGKYAFAYCSSLKTLQIPENVCGISESAFSMCIGLKEVIISDGVTAIGSRVFDGCSSLTSIILPKSVISLGEAVFEQCTQLTNVIILSNITSIENELFMYCSKLTDITIPDSVVKIGDSAFDNCSSLTSIIIPATVKSIGADAFNGCQNISDVYVTDINAWCKILFANADANPLFAGGKLHIQDTFGNEASEIVLQASVKAIPDYTFHNNTNIISVLIPDGVTYIGRSSFSGCTKLTNVTIPDTIISIGYGAFYNCNSLTNITIPNNVTSIDNLAFAKCSGLTDIVIGDGVKSIGNEAFLNCTGLTSVTLGKSLTQIGASVFSNCNNLAYIGVSTENPVYCNDNYGVLYNKSMTTLIQAPRAISGSYTIPDGVRNIESIAFYRCSKLIDIIIPNGVTSIGERAFYGCSSLTGVVIPDGVTSLQDGQFIGCNSLTSVSIPESIINISGNAFSDCSSLQYNVYDNAKYLGNESNLYCVLIEANSNSINSCEIHPNTVVIAPEAFRSCRNLTGITIPASVKSVGDAVFTGCNSLEYNIYDNARYLGNDENPYYVLMDALSTSITALTLHSDVSVIAANAFYACSNLKNVHFSDINAWCKINFTNEYSNPLRYATCLDILDIDEAEPIKVILDDSITMIPDKTFYGWSGLTDIAISKNTIRIGNRAFLKCTGLTNVIIPDSVTSIGESAFNGCSSLSDIFIGAGTSIIGELAFAGCSNLQNVTIPEGVTEIKSNAFSSCNSLIAVTIPDSVTHIGNNAFSNCSSLADIYISDIASWCGISFGDYYANPMCYGKNLFLDQKLVTQLEIPDHVASIGNYAFYGCDSMTEVIIPDSVIHVGKYSFAMCQNLTDVTVGDGVLGIEEGVFYSCTNLVNVDLGKGITYIGTEEGNAILFSGCFQECISLTRISIPNVAVTIGDQAFRGCGRLKDVTISDSVISIGDEAFRGCSSLTELILPDSLESIGNCAFYSCSGLTELIIPDGVVRIGNSAFYGCSGLITARIPSGITQIESFVFKYCDSLTNVQLPDSVTKIDEDAFRDCSSLKYIMLPKNLCVLYTMAFYNCDLTIYGHYKQAHLDALLSDSLQIDNIMVSLEDAAKGLEYKISSDGTYYRVSGIGSFTGNTLVIPDTFKGLPVKEIMDSAFAECTNLAAVVVPEGVERIGDYAFMKCTNLFSILLPHSLKYLGGYSFYWCQKLESIELPDGLDTIGGYAFGYCTALNNLKIPDTVIFIGSYAFDCCSSFTSITVPGSVKTIHDHLFSFCRQLNEITFENGVETIGEYVFFHCSGLQNVNLPTSLRTIEDYAFSCSDLQSVVIPEGVTKISKDAFDRCNYLRKIKLPSTIEMIEDDAFSFNCSYTILFNGTSEEWNAVEKELGWDGYTDYDVIFLKTYADDLAYTLSDDGTYYSVTGIISSDEEIRIASELNGIPVTEIAACAFKDQKSVKRFVIPKTIVKIGESAFSGCTDMEEISFQGTSQQWTSIEKAEDWISEDNENVVCRGDTSGDLDGDNVIDNKDVEYLLWYTLFPEDYPLNTGADYTGDGVVDNQDVAYLLWHTLFPEDYPI